MTTVALAGLAGLALVDSTSSEPWCCRCDAAGPAGTHPEPGGLPGHDRRLLLRRRSRPARRGRAAVAAIGPALETTPAFVAQLAVGIGLVVLSFVIDPKAVAKRRAKRGLPPREPGAWRRRALGPEAAIGTVMGVAVLAGLVEVASMLPYLAAVGILVTAGLPPGSQIAILAGYVLVMITPALVLSAVRQAADSGSNHGPADRDMDEPAHRQQHGMGRRDHRLPVGRQRGGDPCRRGGL